MRFCPFCAAENVDEASHCAVCARKLPAAVQRKPTVAAATAIPPAVKQPEPDLKLAPAAELKRVAGPATVTKPEPAKPEPAKLEPAKPEAPKAEEPKREEPKKDSTTEAYPTVLVPIPDAQAGRPKLVPMPAVPDGGLIEAARYTIAFTRARWQRRAAIASLALEIQKEQASLDAVLGELGKAARGAKLEQRVFAEENKGIEDAESRRNLTEQTCAELTGRKTEENARYESIHHEVAARVSERESEAREAETELNELEAQRRGLRDRKKEIEKRQRAFIKQAEERDEMAGRSQMGDSRQVLRKEAEGQRRDAAKLNVEKEDCDSRLEGLEKPLGDAGGRNDAAKAELDAARRDLENAKEGHRHRIAEIEAEQMRRTRELQQAEAEIARRLVTLGTLVNLHRVEKKEFEPLYKQCDELRAAIGSQETEIERLTAERDAYDKGSLVRGAVVLGGTFIGLITLISVVLYLI